MAFPLEKRLSEEELSNIIKDYQNGLSINKIHQKYNRSGESISKMLTRLGYKSKIGGDCIRKYNFSIHKFIDDSPDKYYWLGFISGYGSIGKKEKRLRIELKDEDKNLLKSFLTFAESNSYIKNRINNKGTHCTCVDINSSELLKYLENYNIIPNKTYTFEMPLDKIPKNYLWDYIRGLMDADGCIYIRQNRKNSVIITFVAKNKKCVEQMCSIWKIDNIIQSNNGAYTIAKEGLSAIKILDKIYKNSNKNNRLERKYAKYRSIIR